MQAKNKPIGGYFEWEFPPMKEYKLQCNPIFLNSGKHALEYVLRGIGEIDHLYIPYFTCIDVIYPLERLKINYVFYHINDSLEIDEDIVFGNRDYLLFTNYYGVCDYYVSSLVEKYENHLIVDNAQALYCYLPNASHQIYSPRKFIGMPDGGIAVSEVKPYYDTLPKDLSYDRCSQLLKRMELSPSEGYVDYKANGKKNIDTPLAQMSTISYNILHTVDLQAIKKQRFDNFNTLNQALKNDNQLSFLFEKHFECPLVYPFLTENIGLKQLLMQNDVFIATYWPNVLKWCKKTDVEYMLTNNVVCIPCDQRYDEDDMNRIIELIAKH